MPLFQNESGCKTFYVKMILIQHENERVGGSILITKVSPEDLPGPCSCLFNKLPDNLKKCDEFKLFCSRIF